MKIIVIIFCVISFCSDAQTCVLAIQAPDTITVAADSKAVAMFSQMENGQLRNITRDTTMCKIKEANNFYFAFAGLMDTITIDMVTRACLSSDSLLQLLRKCADSLTPYLKRNIIDYKSNHSKDEYDKYFAKDLITNILFFGFEKKHSYMVNLRMVNKNPFESYFVDIVPQFDTDYNIRAIGHTAVIEAITTQQWIDKFKVKSKIEVARDLLQQEIKEESLFVGPPIYIMEITKDGYKWIR